MVEPHVVSVHVGKVARLGPGRVRSAFVKSAAGGPVAVGMLGLAGDEQADPRVHGGPDKAVYGYACRHYGAWAPEYPDSANLFTPGGVGENLAIDGIDETDICVGDIHRVGTTLLQVCQPRQPCFKFALRFQNGQLPRAMVRNGRSGWYYRVLREGRVAAGDRLALHDRPNPGFPFPRLVEIVNGAQAAREEWLRLAEMEGLAEQWRERAAQKV